MSKSYALSGAVLVIVYAAVSALSTLVWDPLAAVPGSSYGEVLAGIAAAGESAGYGGAVAALWLVPGPIAGVVLAVLAYAGRLRVAAAVAGQLGLLALGAGAHFLGSFGMGMTVADAFGVSGGAHQSVPLVLYAVSVLALVALSVVGVVVGRRGRMVRGRAGAVESLP